MNRPRVVVVIQARHRSSRLPGKILISLGGRTVLERVIAQARAIPGVDEVVVAVPDGPADEPLRRFCCERKMPMHAGNEDDVLDRFYGAAKAAKADLVLRLTADCPLLDPAVSGRVLETLRKEKADYASNGMPPTFPDGLDTEAFRFSALERAWREARSSVEREHVTPFIRNHPELFKLANHAQKRDLSQLRWTLDDPADLEFLRKVCAQLGRVKPCLKAVLAVIEKDPSLSAINGHIRPNEGYYMSVLKEPPLPAKNPKTARSQRLMKAALKRIPDGSQTFSKAPNQFVQGVAPLLLQKGTGCRVWDVDGNEYIDTTMALGPFSLGYCDPDVDTAVREQMEEGAILTQPHPLELEVAELLAKNVPCAEMVRFGKSGSDATTGAVRLARAYTGRDIVAACGYHGWHDWYIGTTTRNLGVPKAVQALSKTFRYNDIDSLKAVFDAHAGEVAGVIMEPIGVELPRDNFLEKVAELTRKNGAVLIFDEVVTGFRLAMGGAQEHFGVTPDLAALGKAVANGLPLAALVGKAEIMQVCSEIFFSFTFGGDLLSLAAARATIEKMRRKNVIKHLWQQGKRLQDGLNTMVETESLEKHILCLGLGPRNAVAFKNEKGQDWWELKSLMQQECVRRGYLFMGPHTPCYALKDRDVDCVLHIYASVLPILADAVRSGEVAQHLDGSCVQPVFRRL